MTKRVLRLLLAGLLGGAALVAVLPASPAPAVVGSSFNPGNIISDQIFYKSSAMNSAQVQAFLASKYNGCAAGYVCVRDYHVDSANRAADGLCGGYNGLPQESAADIITKVSVSCGINPQVMLVLLQKESSLITTKTPNYQTSAGAGCPDTTGCDSLYFGFFNQVWTAAHQFERYRAFPASYGYVAGRSNFILYNPNQACGGTQVYIQNQATAGLYDYTPYQPNAASLANLGGTGDSCSTYGNRNFWAFFNNWFGSTQSTGSPLFGVVPSTGDIWYYQNGITSNPGGRPYGYGVQVDTGVNVYNRMTTGDVNGDSEVDLVGTKSDGTLWYRANDTSTNQAASWADERQIGSGWNAYSTIVVGDVSGDRHADLLAVKPDGTLWYYPNNINSNPGGYPYGGGTQIGSGWQVFDRLFLADLNGDGFADILATTPAGALYEYINTGTTNLAMPYSSGTQIGSGWQPFNMIVATDVSGDGYADVLGRTPDGNLYYYPNNWNANPGHRPFTGGNYIGFGFDEFGQMF